MHMLLVKWLMHGQDDVKTKDQLAYILLNSNGHKPIREPFHVETLFLQI